MSFKGDIYYHTSHFQIKSCLNSIEMWNTIEIIFYNEEITNTTEMAVT